MRRWCAGWRGSPTAAICSISLRALTAQDAPRAIQLVAALRQRSIDMRRLCEELIAHYRTVMLVGIGADELGLSLSAEDRAAVCRHRPRRSRSPPRSSAMRALGDCLDRMSRGTDPRIELELALFALCGAAQPSHCRAAGCPAAGSRFSAADAAAARPGTAGLCTAAGIQSGGTACAVRPTPRGREQARRRRGIRRCSPAAFGSRSLHCAEQQDPMVHGFLVGSNAYLQGNRVLIDGSELFLRFMKTNKDSARRLKDLIEQASGSHGMRSVPTSAGRQRRNNEKGFAKAEETLRQLQEAGVPVEYR